MKINSNYIPVNFGMSEVNKHLIFPKCNVNISIMKRVMSMIFYVIVKMYSNFVYANFQCHSPFHGSFIDNLILACLIYGA